MNKNTKEQMRQAGLEAIQNIAAYLEVDSQELEGALLDAAQVMKERVARLKRGR